MSFYTGAVKLLSGVLKLAYNLRIHDSENIPETGSYIVVCNHISLGDPIILAISCKRQIYFMAKKELFKVPILGQLVKGLGAFPVDRTGTGLSALKTAIKHLEDQNKLVGMFPQGTRCRSQSVIDTEFKTGASLVAYKSKVGIIPAFIKTKNQKFRLFKRCELYFGKPLTYEQLGFVQGGKDEYENAAEIMKKATYELETKAYNGNFEL